MFENIYPTQLFERMKFMDQASITGAYYIQQVADITGISKQVIRKWEERYQLIQPTRLDNGYRIYSDKDINTLLTVKALAEQGHSIKQAAILVKTENVSIDVKTFSKSELTQNHEEMNHYVLQLLQNGTICNEEEINHTLQQAYYHLGLERFIQSVIIPFLKEIGHRWETGQRIEFQESLASLSIRDFLVPIRRNFQHKSDAPLLLGACLPYEQHEIPVHLLLLQSMLRGWKTMLIGSSPAPGSIESLVEKLKPNKVLLSATTTIPFDKDPHLIERLEYFASNHPDTEFYLGGAGSMEYASEMNLQVIQLTNSLDDLFDRRMAEVDNEK